MDILPEYPKLILTLLSYILVTDLVTGCQRLVSNNANNPPSLVNANAKRRHHTQRPYLTTDTRGVLTSRVPGLDLTRVGV